MDIIRVWWLEKLRRRRRKVHGTTTIEIIRSFYPISLRRYFRWAFTTEKKYVWEPAELLWCVCFLKVFFLCFFLRDVAKKCETNEHKISLCEIIFSALTVAQQAGEMVHSFALYNRFMHLHNIFLWRRFYLLQYEEEPREGNEITIIIYPLRCRFPPKKANQKKSQIIRNIYVAQINSRWNESAEDICTILFKMQFLRGRIMHRLLLLYFSVRQSSN